MASISALIEALEIVKNYVDKGHHVNCSHDVLAICHLEKEKISKKDMDALQELGFFWSNEYDTLISFRYGSC